MTTNPPFENFKIVNGLGIKLNTFVRFHPIDTPPAVIIFIEDLRDELFKWENTFGGQTIELAIQALSPSAEKIKVATKKMEDTITSIANTNRDLQNIAKVFSFTADFVAAVASGDPKKLPSFADFLKLP